jgi:hypothetical protein
MVITTANIIYNIPVKKTLYYNMCDENIKLFNVGGNTKRTNVVNYQFNSGPWGNLQ